MEVLIKNVRIVDWVLDFYGEVYIDKGEICEVGKRISKKCKVIDGKGKVLMPAFVDMHAHFRDPGFSYKEDILSGSRAAVRGGYTTVNLMANTNPVSSDMHIVNYVREKAREIGLIDVHQAVSITKDLDGKTLSHLDEIEGNVKFISDDGKGVSNDKIMFEAMLKAKSQGITVISHAENPEMSGIDMRAAENMMTLRDIYLAKHTGCRLHMAHVSTKEAIGYIIQAKKEGVKITCEVTPHHLALTSEYEYKVNPPIREKEDVDFLVKAIRDGFIDAIATDHAPHTAEDKLNRAPGISGIETSFSVCYTKLVKKENISLNKLSELMSKRPAEIMGLNKGQISIGFEGDLVLVDLDEEYVINSKDFMSKGKNTPFDGHKVFGKVLMTIKGGKIVYQNS
ncbi:dihydroorotase [Clostridium thermopalmarium]|uniref:Dihydroorotase n=1 Tax=Clostridium thermopalmarium DSM 5974 TaxID=1121340 RepID=A0A2T0APS9_9CLOT|nr:dihydroorotase [Clostridium thermopalmarium]PRR71029.1 Dihydroorotase [Clostridium thermopalmarium DSM 5974]PVZ23631.1 dihydroorotase [Clostridium thermopalmarium DSM 5974]